MYITFCIYPRGKCSQYVLGRALCGRVGTVHSTGTIITVIIESDQTNDDGIGRTGLCITCGRDETCMPHFTRKR
jgi:hypothetical protein